MRFADRTDAGQRLAATLRNLQGQRPAVLAIPRGGVVVGREVARELGGTLHAVPVKKVAAPFNPELAIGAVAADGTHVLNEEAVRLLGITPEELQAAISDALAEARRRAQAYLCEPMDLSGRPALVVDDGLATGYTALAAARYARRLNPLRLLVAVPVAARSSAAMVATQCDEFVALMLPDDMEAVGQYYDDFSATTDDVVLRILAEHSTGLPGLQGPPPTPTA